jgi:glutaredoxin
VLGLSVDSKDSLKAWAESLGGITYPLLSDFYPHGQVAQTYGVLRSEGYSERALFVIDKRGIIRYVDIHDIDLQPDNETLFEILEEMEPVVTKTNRTAGKAVRPEPSPEPQVDVVMYCTPWCPDCKRARGYFKELGVEYLEIDITRDRAAAARVRGWNEGFEQTPTFKIKGTILSEFNVPKIEKLLNVKR